MEASPHYLRLTEKEFLKIAEMNVEALNESTAGLPADKVIRSLLSAHSHYQPCAVLTLRVSAQNAFMLGKLAWTSS